MDKLPYGFRFRDSRRPAPLAAFAVGPRQLFSRAARCGPGFRIVGFSRQFRGEALPRVGFSRYAELGGIVAARKTRSDIPNQATSRRPKTRNAGANTARFRAAFDDSMTLRRERHRMPEEDPCGERRHWPLPTLELATFTHWQHLGAPSSTRAPPRRWWRRGESNSRPKPSHCSVYVRVPPLSLAHRTADGRAIRCASGHEKSRRSSRPPGVQPAC